jgi:hypothetical protein
MPRTTNSVGRAKAVDVRLRVLEMRKAGATFEAIGREFGRSKQWAYAHFQKSLAATYQVPADEVRKLEAERLDRLQMALWPGALAGDDKKIGRVLQVMERRAKLLGLDAPVKQEVTGTDGGPIQYAQVFSHEAVAAAITARSGGYHPPPGADESSGDGETLGEDLHGRRLRTDHG